MRNLSVITAVEESDGRDSSVVRRPIEIVSNPRHNQGRTVRRPLNGMGLKGKVAPPGIEPRPSFPFKPMPFKGLRTVRP